MKFIKTEIDGCYLITFETYHDGRGYFAVPFNEDEFNQFRYGDLWLLLPSVRYLL